MLFIILVIVLSSVLLYLSLRPNNYWKKRNILQVDDIMVKFILNKHSLPEICKDICDKHEDEIIGTSSGATQNLLLKNPQDIQAVLTGDFQNFHSRGFLLNPNDLLGDNLLFMNDFQKWKMTRQKLTPIFTSSRLKNMFYIVDKCACDFVELVENTPQSSKMRKTPYNLVYTYTTASIGASMFGIDTQAKSTMDSPFVDMAWKASEPTRIGNTLLFLAAVYPNVFKLLKLKVFGQFENFFIGAIKSVLQTRKNDHDMLTKRQDFIEICKQLKKQGKMQDLITGFELDPSDELIAAQAFFFFVAGADTSANVMQFTLIELASNPKVLAKLHKEIDEVFTAENEVLTYDNIEKLQYLDMVVSEATRKYPPIGIIQRLCARNSVLPSGVSVEKDVICMIPVMQVQRDEKNFPNPEVFDPERFSPENVSNVKKYTFLPFGEGNRNCIGGRFARLQVKAGLARLLRKFTLTPQELKPVVYEKSTFGLRSPDVYYELKPRNM